MIIQKPEYDSSLSPILILPIPCRKNLQNLLLVSNLLDFIILFPVLVDIDLFDYHVGKVSVVPDAVDIFDFVQGPSLFLEDF